MGRPIIGITMCLDNSGAIRAGVDYSYIRREYGQQVRRAGGEPIFLDNTISPEAAVRLCQGFIISGGEDIDPSFYGQANRSIKVTEPLDRTRWECRLIDRCDKYERPILGICYGVQLLNVHYGGTLHQDVYLDTGTKLNHGSSTQAAYAEIAFEQDFLGFADGEIVQTAHRHHQAVHQLAPGFQVAARAQDGTVEAIAGRGHYGVQWHAESDGSAEIIYRNFVQMCAPAPARQVGSDGTVVEAL